MFDRVSKAVPKAFEDFDRASGNSPDQDVRLYDTLRPQDFLAITQEYGADQVSDYIREMERKRMKGR